MSRPTAPPEPLKLEALFFDFDGVVMDSMDLKLDSYSYALEEHGFARHDIKHIQVRDAGITRHQVLRTMYLELAGEEIGDQQFDTALERFNRHDDESRAKMEWVPGTRAVLDTVARRYFTAIITGTPQQVIDESVDFFELRRYFQEARGGPVDKRDHLRELMATRGLRPEDCVYIGDAIKDQESADDCGVPFIGLDRGDAPFESERAWIIVESLEEVVPYLGRR